MFHKDLLDICSRVFKAAGADTNVSEIVAHHLVEANLCGVDSHGVIRVAPYVKSILGISEDQEVQPIRPKAKIRTIRDNKSVGIVDGGWGFGQPAAKIGMLRAMEKAEDYGIGAVGLLNCGHIGRLGAYSSMALEKDFIGIVVAKTFPVMAPFGGASRVLGNNPYSFAAPAGKELPIVVDFATSTAARGKLLAKRARGEEVPRGWIVDRNGQATVDPQAFFDGGSLLPFAQHKGYGLSVIGELLGGALVGISPADYAGHNSALLMAIDIESFTSLDSYKASVDDLVKTVKTSKLAEGFGEILMPGEPEAREKEKRFREGVPIDDKTMEEVRWAAERVGVRL